MLDLNDVSRGRGCVDWGGDIGIADIHSTINDL